MDEQSEIFRILEPMFGIKEDSPVSGLKIEIIEPAFGTRGNNESRQLSVQKNGRIVFGIEGIRRLNIALEEYALVGNVGESWYICKRPAGTFKGYKLINQKGKNSLTMYIQSKSLSGIELGEYVLGEAVDQDGLAWHQLVKIDA